MSPWDILRELYDSEINAGMESDWDNGFKVWFGDQYNGRSVERTFGRSEFELIATWLDSEARKRFPDSEFASRP